MPGRLVMENPGAMTGSGDLKRKRSEAQDCVPKGKQPAADSTRPLENGANGALSNGVPHVNGTLPGTNGDSSRECPALATSANLMSQLPPELDQTWRETANYKPLGLLMERLAQQCYFNLNQLIDEMAASTTSQTPPTTNGVVHGAPDTSRESINKKLRILEFAQSQRDRFIKTLVLSDWSRNIDDINNLIDVKLWAEKMILAHDGAAFAIGQTKLNMIQAKMPNPNIDTAMELLTTGKAIWMPDLGYIPPKRLGPKELKDTVRSINITLAARLNLHEDVPSQFQDWRIADGRATLVVPDEFEVDLSVGDDKMDSPWYFIDLRFLFSPSSGLIDDSLRAFLEPRQNVTLKERGLKGCYDVLHNLVLTHKINLLRQQANEMARNRWFDCIRIEQVRRNLCIQYWSGLPGPKSWVEIGVVSGKEKVLGAPRWMRGTPRISVRWFRHGVEVKYAKLDWDWSYLNMARNVERVISMHRDWLLNSVRDRMLEMANGAVAFKAELSLEDQEHYLTLSLQSLEVPLEIRIDQVTGEFRLMPATQGAILVGQRLNDDPTLDVPRWLASLLCGMLQEQVQREAYAVSWKPVHTAQRQETLRKLFGAEVLRWSIFAGVNWGTQWAVAATFDLRGEKWWIIELSDGDKLQHKTILDSQRLPTQTEHGTSLGLSAEALVQIARLAVAKISFAVLSKQMKVLRIPHDLERSELERLPPPAEGSKENEQSIKYTEYFVDMAVRFADLMRDKGRRDWKPWASEFVRIAHRGLELPVSEDGLALVVHEVRVLLHEPIAKQLREFLKQSERPAGNPESEDSDGCGNASYPDDREDSVAALHSPSGVIGLLVKSGFGETFAEALQLRLRSVERLSGQLASLKEQSFTPTTATLSRLAFVYGKTPNLSAEIRMSSDGNSPARLRLLPPGSNPHQRIRIPLEQSLNRHIAERFGEWTHTLSITLPLLQIFERMESGKPERRDVAVCPRSPTWYTLKYKTPLPVCAFNVRARGKIASVKHKVVWHIEQALSPANKPALPNELSTALKEFWKKSDPTRAGLSNGVVVDAKCVEQVLQELDETVRRFEGQPAEPDKPAKPREASISNELTKTTAPSKQPPSKPSAEKLPSKGPQERVSEVIELD